MARDTLFFGGSQIEHVFHEFNECSKRPGERCGLVADSPVSPTLQWLTMIGLIVFALVVAWDVGFVDLVVHSDRSGISVAIALVFVAASIHAAYRAWVLSRELEFAERLARVRHGIEDDTDERDPGLAGQHLACVKRSGGGDQMVLIEALRERTHFGGVKACDEVDLAPTHSRTCFSTHRLPGRSEHRLSA